jgi:hypothetical protein
MTDINFDEIAAGLGDKLQDPIWRTTAEREAAATTTTTATTTATAPAPGTPAYSSLTPEQRADQERVQRQSSPPVQPPSTILGSGPGSGDTYTNPIMDPSTPATSNKEDNFAAEAAADTPTPEYALLRDLLRQFGLDNIYSTVAQFITSESSPAEITLAMREVPEFRSRFSVIFDREEQGLPPVSAAEVVDYEKRLERMFSFYGVPRDPGENLQETAAELMLNDVSYQEAEQRLTAQAAFGRAVLDDPNQDQAVVQAILGNGGTVYDVANFVMDPAKTLDQIERRLVAAEIGNEASQAQYGQLSPEEAMELSRQGLTGAQAEQGFGVLNQNRQVIDRLVGDNADPITREQELAAVSGDLNAQAAIERSRQSRVAAFQVGGNFATGEEGFEGLR